MYNKNKNIENNNNDDLIQTRSKSAKNVIVNKPNLEAYKRSIIYSGATAWNSLNLEMKNLEIFEVFKYHQKREMLTF